MTIDVYVSSLPNYRPLYCNCIIITGQRVKANQYWPDQARPLRNLGEDLKVITKCFM